MQNSFAIHTHTNGRYIFTMQDTRGNLIRFEVSRDAVALLLKIYRRYGIVKSVIPSGFTGCTAIRYTVKF